MLYFNISKLFKLRNISKPRIFLKNNGFSYSQAKNLVTYRLQSISPRVVEKLCLALNCTPNDLLEWSPEGLTQNTENHPLHALKPRPELNFTESVKDFPIEKIPELIKSIESLKKNTTP